VAEESEECSKNNKHTKTARSTSASANIKVGSRWGEAGLNKHGKSQKKMMG
jgi:hypothetical protein